jgi:hypothetical protein
MLSFRLGLADVARPQWSWIDDRWINGESWIKPIINPALEWQLVHDDQATACVVVRERRRSPADSASTVDAKPVTIAPRLNTTDAPNVWAGEFTRVDISRGRVRITAGGFGTAPLYLTTSTDAVIGSWNLPDLRPYIVHDRLLGRALARALTRQHRYSSDTLFENVKRLTERAAATFNQSGLTIHYPEPAEHVLRARTLRPNVDAIGAFHELLTHVVTQTAALPGDVGIELSGGADSANVGLALAARRDDQIRSYGLIMDGQCGGSQRHRRAAMVRRFGFHDQEIAAGDHPPFAIGGVRALGTPHDPVAAHYREAFDALRNAASASRTRVMFTGLGGDEVNAPLAKERVIPIRAPDHVPWLGPTARAALKDIDENLAPVAPTPLPTLMAFALHNPAYLQAGIWPVAPLADHKVVRFAEQLPLELRRGKALFRQRLQRAGFSADVADPPQPENFTELMQAGLRTFGLGLLRDMLRASMLVDMGYLDHRVLARAYEEARNSDRVPSLLCDVIKIEVGLRSLQ